MINIAIAGNPNSGKTTIFNYLTGMNERVGNWMGVTVDLRKGMLRHQYKTDHDTIMITDLPGTYSSEGYTRDEIISIEYLKSQEVDAILNIIDINQLERGLLLTLDLLSCGKPVVIVLNKQDVAIKQKLTVDVPKLKELLQSDVVLAQAIHNIGIDEALGLLLGKLKENDNGKS